MIYYVYFDPQIISTAQEKGNIGIQLLIGILQALSQNCFLAEFKNYSNTQEEIGNQLKGVVGDFDIATLKKVLTRFSKENLFVECLDYDYSLGISEAEMAQKCCTEALLDLLLLSDDAKVLKNIPVETATLEDYYNSDFEPIRNHTAAKGFAFAEAALNENDFLEKYFKKVLKYARSIEIFDYQCGEKYKANYDYTLSKFLSWLETENAEDLTITLYCGFPDTNQSAICSDDDLVGLTPEEIEPLKQQKIFEAVNAHYKKSEIKVICSDNKFAHDRFIVTNQTAFEIGIGMDFLNNRGVNQGKNRNTTMNLKGKKDVRNALGTIETNS